MFSAYMTTQWVTWNIISFLSRWPCVSFTEGAFFLGDGSLNGRNVLQLLQVEQVCNWSAGSSFSIILLQV